MLFFICFYRFLGVLLFFFFSFFSLRFDITINVCLIFYEFYLTVNSGNAVKSSLKTFGSRITKLQLFRRICFIDAKNTHNYCWHTYCCVFSDYFTVRTINYNLIQIFTMWARTIRFVFCHLISLIARVNWRLVVFPCLNLLFKFQRFTCAIGHISIVSCFIWCRRFVVAVFFWFVDLFLLEIFKVCHLFRTFLNPLEIMNVSSQVHVYNFFFIYSDALTHWKPKL